MENKSLTQRAAKQDRQPKKSAAKRSVLSDGALTALAAAVSGRAECSQLFADGAQALQSVPNGALLAAVMPRENAAAQYSAVMTGAQPPRFAPAPETALGVVPQGFSPAQPPVFAPAPECAFDDAAGLL